MTPPRDSRLTRRQFARAAGAAGLALLGLAGCQRADTGRWAGRSLLVATPGGAERLAFWGAAFVPFARDTDCRVMEVEAPDPVAPLRQQVLAGGAQWDVAALDAALLGELAADGLLTPLDYARLPRSAVLPGLALDYGVGVLLDTVAAAYRPGPFGADVPGGWPGLWRLTAPRSPWTLPQAAPGLLEAALLADGVAPAALYPLDVSRALAALDRVRPGVSFWWDKPDDPQEALDEGRVDVAVARGGDLRAAVAGGAGVALAPVAPVAMPVVWAIPRGAPNADVALDFIAYTLGARPQTALAAAGYAPAVPPPATATPAPTRPPIPLNLQWWHDHGRDARARFAVWVNG